MQRYRLDNPHESRSSLRHARRRRAAALARTASIEQVAAESLRAFGFHRNRVATRARSAQGRVARTLAAAASRLAPAA